MPSETRLKILWGILSLGPLWHLGLLALTAGLGANPIEKILHTTGDWTLNGLCLTLAITPLCRLTGWTWPAPWRRGLGWISLAYAFLHVLTYGVLDQGLSWSAIGADLLKRRYINAGMASLLLLSLPAVAALGPLKRRLGDRTRRLLQQFPVYGAALAGVIHYLWLVKRDLRRPLAYAAVLALLLGYRVVAYFRKNDAS